MAIKLIKVMVFISVFIAPGVHITFGAVVISQYDRDQYGQWTDNDGNGRNTRHELLAELSTTPPTFSTNGKYVTHGRWVSPWTGEVHFSASEIDIDHTIPLAYAHLRGAAKWSTTQKRAFANDTRNLQAVEATLNRQKGSSGVTEWTPPKNKCQYVLRFHRLMRVYGLTYMEWEIAPLNELLITCNGNPIQHKNDKETQVVPDNQKVVQ
ncbi:GmrSD restriction endonuclease domain-containing protein [Shewanella algae]|uniref:GmrSD restriction endonuclease domain-containing protein n=1 Tax=Shewanella algae TaxID=38313 RepID=UPI003B68044A